MKHDDLPGLLAGIQIVDHPLPKRSGITHESRRRRVEGISAGQVVVEEMRICVEKEKMRVAVVERVVALVIDLQACTLAGVNPGRVSKCADSGRRGVRLSLIAESEAGGHRRVDVPCILDVESHRAILRKIEIIEIGECIASAQIAAEGV